MQLNGIYQFEVCANRINVLGENIYTIKEMTEAVLEVNGEVVLEGNTEKTKYMVVSRQQSVGQSHNLLIANKFFTYF
jgi:hypothetical protein